MNIQEFIQTNYHLVEKVVAKYEDTFENRVRGTIGLLKAKLAYDANQRNDRFDVYALWFIRQEIDPEK